MQAPPRGGGFLGKRKERQYGYYPPSSTWSSSQQTVRFAPPPPPPRFFAKPGPRTSKPYRPAVFRPAAKSPATPPPPADAVKCAAGTKLLAGYLAHEFLTYGTVRGEPMVPPPPPIQKAKHPAALAPSGAAAPPEPSERYAEVSRLIMAGGACIPGIVNPSQLGGWLGIKDKK